MTQGPFLTTLSRIFLIKKIIVFTGGGRGVDLRNILKHPANALDKFHDENWKFANIHNYLAPVPFSIILYITISGQTIL